MIARRISVLCVTLALGLGLGACTDGYGYDGLAVGYGNGYGDYYGNPYGEGYGGYGYGQSNFGWYGDYYYPGTGVFVYDSYRRPYRWNGAQQRYWRGQQRFRGHDWNGQGAWNRFDRGGGSWQGDGDRRGWQGQNPNVDRDRGRRFGPGRPAYRGALDGQGYRDRAPRAGSPGGGSGVRAPDTRGGSNWGDRGSGGGGGGRSSRQDSGNVRAN